MKIEPIPAFNDNYIWLLHANGKAWVVDPGDSAPVASVLTERGLNLEGVLVTHHHFDHTGGIAGLRQLNNDLQVVGPASDHYEDTTATVVEGDSVEVLGLSLKVITIPGHTLDHIAYYGDTTGQAPVLFCGDTLFAGGCGRVFEGTPPMMHQSLARLANLPADTVFYCAHEYTMANLDFARAVEPDNKALLLRIERDQGRREQNIPTVPSTIGEELATNPFLRSTAPAVIAAAQSREPGNSGTPEAVFGAIREWKNNF